MTRPQLILYDTKDTQVLKCFAELDAPGRYDIIAGQTC